MPDYEELIREWSNEQCFTVWACDHAAVLRNLSKWMDGRAGGWVSVKERLPENDYTDVITAFEGKVTCLRFAHGKFYDMGYEQEVTHWQPLPEPPKGDE